VIGLLTISTPLTCGNVDRPHVGGVGSANLLRCARAFVGTKGPVTLSKPSRRKIEDLAEENARLKATLREMRRFGAFSNATKFTGQLFKAATIITPCYFAARIVHDLAGKTTQANINASGSVSIESESIGKVLEDFLGGNTLTAMAFAFAIACFFYGKRQAALRRRAIAHLQPAKAAKELKIDPKRTSSLLTEHGDTNPKDE
jgi:hypothetical protein